MAWFNRDRGDAFNRYPGKEESGDIFYDIWPNDSAGTGKIKANNKSTGIAQGKGSLKRKAACQQCGYVNDLNKVDHTGGSEDGDGAGGAVSKSTQTVIIASGLTSTTYKENIGDQTVRKGSGCALCFSKNNSSEVIDVVDKAEIYVVPPIGF